VRVGADSCILGDPVPLTPRELVSDALCIAGAASIAWGLWHLWPPGAWIFGGTLSLVYGVLLGRT
jgi:hypothetical protein